MYRSKINVFERDFLFFTIFDFKCVRIYENLKI
jgi:hypothetical protein